jgi:PAB-dependent poly(A)-specific ribonuclease subunit 2
VYVNAAVQALFFTPPFRDGISQHSCERDVCMSCELQFLFAMLDVGRAGVAVEAGNFTKAFLSMASAGALGLLDGPTALPLAARIESFTRYLLEQLHKDAGGNDASGVSRLTGADAVSYGRFTPSGVEWDRGSRPFQHTLNYDNAPLDFAALVKQTLYREMAPTRAFCATTGTFEMMTQTRRLTTLPNLLLLGANMKADGYSDWWFEMDEAKSKAGEKSMLNWDGDIDDAMRCTPRLAESLRLEIDEDTNHLSVVDTSSGVGEEGRVGSGAFRTAYDTASGDVVDTGDRCADYEISFVIAWVTPREQKVQPENPTGRAGNADGHLVAYIRVPASYRKDSEGAGIESDWWCLNDFVIGPCACGWREVASFSDRWKRPCVVGYVRRDVVERIGIDNAGSLCAEKINKEEMIRAVIGSGRCNSAVGIGADEKVPGVGTVVGLDCEFVMMEREDCEISGDGVRTVVTPARMALARVSVVRGDDGPMRGVALIDDYVAVKEEQVVDFLTRFSGIQPGDLDSCRSRRTVLPLKRVYKKLLALVDAGVIFVGHGLKKDLRVLNFAVPSTQVVDTVMLFRGSGKGGGRRLLSLRYLMGALLGVGIQEGGASGHDSVEDAAAAVRVYRAWEELSGRGTIDAVVSALYAYGYAHGWKNDPVDPFVVE